MSKRIKNDDVQYVAQPQKEFVIVINNGNTNSYEWSDSGEKSVPSLHKSNLGNSRYLCVDSQEIRSLYGLHQNSTSIIQSKSNISSLTSIRSSQKISSIAMFESSQKSYLNLDSVDNQQVSSITMLPSLKKSYPKLLNSKNNLKQKSCTTIKEEKTISLDKSEYLIYQKKKSIVQPDEDFRIKLQKCVASTDKNFAHQFYICDKNIQENKSKIAFYYAKIKVFESQYVNDIENKRLSYEELKNMRKKLDDAIVKCWNQFNINNPHSTYGYEQQVLIHKANHQTNDLGHCYAQIIKRCRDHLNNRLFETEL